MPDIKQPASSPDSAVRVFRYWAQPGVNDGLSIFDRYYAGLLG
jgi:hypothetical protein